MAGSTWGWRVSTARSAIRIWVSSPGRSPPGRALWPATPTRCCPSRAVACGRGPGRSVGRVPRPGGARPVLLLHGLGVTGAVWQSFARRLLPHLAAVAPDLRGHGQSEAPPGASYMLADYANDLVELTSGELPTPVVGHSLGALVAVALADQQPERVAWLVLIDPPLDAQRRNPDVPRVAELRRGPSGALED